MYQYSESDFLRGDKTGFCGTVFDRARLVAQGSKAP